METDHLMDSMGSVPILPIKWTITIGIMLNFDGDGDGTCKQALTPLDADLPDHVAVMHAGKPPLPLSWTEGMTHGCEKITLPQTSFAGG